MATKTDEGKALDGSSALTDSVSTWKPDTPSGTEWEQQEGKSDQVVEHGDWSVWW